MTPQTNLCVLIHKPTHLSSPNPNNNTHHVDTNHLPTMDCGVSGLLFTTLAF